MQIDIVGIDDYPVVDLLISVDKLPTTDEMIFTKGQSWQCGGKVATAMATAGRLGAKTGIIGIVGMDNLGRFCKDDFKRHSVDTKHLILHSGAATMLSVALAERSTKGRSFIAVEGGCRRLAVDDLDKEYIQNAKFLHLWQMTPATVQAAKWAKEAGVTVVFDADVFDAAIMENLELIDVLIASEFFFKDACPNSSLRDGCEILQKTGPQITVVTLGKLGCAGIDGEGFFEMPAFLNIEVVDTTGAGDVFHGAFIYAMLQGMATRDCARFSCAVAAIKCTRPGGRAAIPSREVVDRFLLDGHIDYNEIDRRVKWYSQCRLGDKL